MTRWVCMPFHPLRDVCQTGVSFPIDVSSHRRYADVGALAVALCPFRVARTLFQFVRNAVLLMACANGVSLSLALPRSVSSFGRSVDYMLFRPFIISIGLLEQLTRSSSEYERCGCAFDVGRMLF